MFPMVCTLLATVTAQMAERLTLYQRIAELEIEAENLRRTCDDCRAALKEQRRAALARIQNLERENRVLRERAERDQK
jgi:hypothetical protein